MNGASVVRLDRVRKVYGGATPLEALRCATLSIRPGSFCVIEGPSGSGKTTLLAVAGGLERPTSGRVWLGETEITGLNGRRLLAVRRAWLGFVFQDFKLIDVLTAEENVALALELRGTGSGSARARSRDLLARLGLNGRAKNRPGELSGGEKQRVAIARALSTSPRVLLADEPTANLDWGAGSEVVTLLRSASRTLGTAVVVVSHDPRVAAHADRVVRIADGVVDDADERGNGG